MKLRSTLLATAFGFGMAFVATQASAVTVTGTSGGSFSGLSNCDNSGSSQDCQIVNTGNGNNTQVQWAAQQQQQLPKSVDPDLG